MRNTRSKFLANCNLTVAAGLTLVVAVVSSSRATAQSTDKSENITIATVPVEPGIDAIVVFDHLTGNLSGFVMSPSSGKFFAQYLYKGVNNDLKLGRNKPKYTLVTGKMEFRNQSAGTRLGQGVIYIMEETSGNMVAYGMPWSSSLKTNPRAVTAQFRPLDIRKVRDSRKSSGTRRSSTRSKRSTNKDKRE